MLPPVDKTSLIGFYDALREVTDNIDTMIRDDTEAGVNHWNVLMQKVQNNLAIGKRAVQLICPDAQFSAISPAGGTLLSQVERAIAGAHKALSAHLRRRESMANVYIEARPKGRSEGSRIDDYVVEDHADHVLGTFKTQREAIDWVRSKGHAPLVARVRHLNDKKKPDHWRAA